MKKLILAAIIMSATLTANAQAVKKIAGTKGNVTKMCDKVKECDKADKNCKQMKACEQKCEKKCDAQTAATCQNNDCQNKAKCPKNGAKKAVDRRAKAAQRAQKKK